MLVFVAVQFLHLFLLLSTHARTLTRPPPMIYKREQVSTSRLSAAAAATVAAAATTAAAAVTPNSQPLQPTILPPVSLAPSSPSLSLSTDARRFRRPRPRPRPPTTNTNTGPPRPRPVVAAPAPDGHGSRRRPSYRSPLARRPDFLCLLALALPATAVTHRVCISTSPLPYRPPATKTLSTSRPHTRHPPLLLFLLFIFTTFHTFHTFRPQLSRLQVCSVRCRPPYWLCSKRHKRNNASAPGL